jgi:hypothetical protein
MLFTSSYQNSTLSILSLKKIPFIYFLIFLFFYFLIFYLIFMLKGKKNVYLIDYFVIYIDNKPFNLIIKPFNYKIYSTYRIS